MIQHNRHFPDNADKFEFDAEVASIFDNMTVRSIPLYKETHRLAVELAARAYYQCEDKPFRILDIGASTGTFFKGLWNRLGYRVEDRIPDLEAVAIDPSYPMCEKIKKSLPRVEVQNIGVEDVYSLMDVQGKKVFDFITALYVYQFVPIEGDKRRAAIWDTYGMLNVDGVLVAANKEKMSAYSDQAYSHMYRQFRMDNGYTIEEIEAKTRALSNSMWTERGEDFIICLADTGFSRVEQMCRWLQFATYVAYK
jgi:tRNA (cmo5U34)-methyltransferase